MQYLLVGEAPSRDGSWQRLECKIAKKVTGWKIKDGSLLEWLEREHLKILYFCRATTHVNLLTTYPGHDAGGTLFPAVEGAARALGLIAHLETGMPWFTFSKVSVPRPDCVLLAGMRVAKAFGCGGADMFEVLPRFVRPGLPPMIVVPHPSGVSRWWNDPQNRRVALAFFNALGTAANIMR